MLCNSCMSVLKTLLERDFDPGPQWRYLGLPGLRKTGSTSYKLEYEVQDVNWEDSSKTTCLMCRSFIQYHCPGMRQVSFSAIVVRVFDDQHNFKPRFSVFNTRNGENQPPQPAASRNSAQYDIFVPEDSKFQSPSSVIQNLEVTFNPSVLDNLPRLPVQTPIDPEKSEVLGVIRKWIAECSKYHKECARRSTSQLPTRVIDVGLEGGSEAPRIIVTQGRNAEYIALSHRWTEITKQFATTEENLERRLQGMPHGSFPPTFRGAITLTRKLSFRYLWIDNICIIQDDEKDWARECHKMCDIFENAVFTISALGDSTGMEGIMACRHEPQSLILGLKDGRRIGIRQVPLSMRDAIETSAMDRRGWILQERILSPAILHIGQSQMYWECCSRTASEYQPQGEPHSEGRLKHLLVIAQRKPLKREARDPYLQWYKMLDIFTRKSLTFEFDRLPAIMGLSRRFQNLVKSTFVAGLWLEDLHRGLLWLKLDETKAGLAHSYSNLPSWSWIQVIGNVGFEGRDPGYRKGKSGPYNIYPMLRVMADTDIDIVDVDVSTRLPNPHRMMKGLIQAWGILIRVTYQPPTNPRHERIGYLSRCRRSQLGALPCFLDILCTESNECYCLLIADWIFEWAWDGLFGKKHELAVPKQRCYLVLNRVKRPQRNANPLALGEFRRIGVGVDDPALVKKFFGNTRKGFLTLV